MIALDTNLLVYAHRPESPYHDRALEVLEGLCAGRKGNSGPLSRGVRGDHIEPPPVENAVER